MSVFEHIGKTMNQKILLKGEKIRKRVAELAMEIDAWGSKSQTPVCAIWLAEGALFFAADLLRLVHLPDLGIHSLKVSSYGNEMTAQSAPKLMSPLPEVDGKRVLLIDDVLDTGKTLEEVAKILKTNGAAEVKICVLLKKTCKAKNCLSPDFAGFEVGNEFAFGYGMDVYGKKRELADIMVVG